MHLPKGMMNALGAADHDKQIAGPPPNLDTEEAD